MLPKRHKVVLFILVIFYQALSAYALNRQLLNAPQTMFVSDGAESLANPMAQSRSMSIFSTNEADEAARFLDTDCSLPAPDIRLLQPCPELIRTESIAGHFAPALAIQELSLALSLNIGPRYTTQSTASSLAMAKSFLESNEALSASELRELRALEADRIPWSDFLYAGHLRYTIDGAQPYRNSHVNYLALSATGGVYLGVMIGLHLYQANTFWSQRSPLLTVREDGNYARGVDKIGHVFGATLMSYYSTEVLQGSGVCVESAHIWGTLMGLMYQTYVEIEDGYGKNWGFSPSDMYMNIAGASFFLLQYYVPSLQNVTEKWIYTPATWIQEQARKNGETFIDDYSSSTFFFSFKMHNIFPENIARSWPRWLNLAVGYAARGLDTPQEDTKLILALDYDLPELLPDFRQSIGGWLGDFCNWMGQSLNYVKFPSPAIEIGEHGHTRFNLLYPFKLSIGNIKF